jgi:hypothetical protein
MKRHTVSILIVTLLTMTFGASVVMADPPSGFDSNGKEIAWQSTGCANIQSGTITASDGSVIAVGFDQYGYNYQAHLFQGTYDSVDRVLDGKYWGTVDDYVDDSLSMKWSDDWLANVDCNHDGKLDRGLVNSTVTGISLGWTTNHVEGDYLDGAGVEQHYTYFVKIVWVGPGGSLWGQYEVVEEIYNDPAGGSTGLLYKTEPGLGVTP